MYVLTAGHIVAVFDRNRAETSALSAGPITLTSLPNNDAVRVSVDCMDDRSICPQGRSRWPACPAPLRLRRSQCVRRVHRCPFHPQIRSRWSAISTRPPVILPKYIYFLLPWLALSRRSSIVFRRLMFLLISLRVWYFLKLFKFVLRFFIN